MKNKVGEQPNKMQNINKNENINADLNLNKNQIECKEVVKCGGENFTFNAGNLDKENLIEIENNNQNYKDNAFNQSAFLKLSENESGQEQSADLSEIESIFGKSEFKSECESEESGSENASENVDKTDLQNGSPYGKFKTANDLLNAYNNLQAEFTRRCQALKKMQNQIDLMQNKENSFKDKNLSNVNQVEKINQNQLDDMQLNRNKINATNEKVATTQEDAEKLLEQKGIKQQMGKAFFEKGLSSKEFKLKLLDEIKEQITYDKDAMNQLYLDALNSPDNNAESKGNAKSIEIAESGKGGEINEDKKDLFDFANELENANANGKQNAGEISEEKGEEAHDNKIKMYDTADSEEVPSYQRADFDEQLAKFLSVNKDARFYAKEIGEEILADRTLSLQCAYDRVLAKRYKAPNELASDENFIANYILNNEKVLKRIVKDFKAKREELPRMISNQNGAMAQALPSAVRTIKEAGELAYRLFD